jgi:hypothetical protein
MKKHSRHDLHESRDPTLIVPKNIIQAGEIDYTNYQLQGDASTEYQNSSEKQGATRSIYQALKRGLRRLSSIRRNNSA